jgi:hypothetical protein
MRRKRGVRQREGGVAPLSILIPLSKQFVYVFVYILFGEGDQGDEVIILPLPFLFPCHSRESGNPNLLISLFSPPFVKGD